MSQITKNLHQAHKEGHISKEALKNISTWLEQAKYQEYRSELTQLIEQKKWQTLNDNFWQVLPFGTGGRRGTVGVGSNRINRVTMGESAQAFAEYVAKAIPGAEQQGIIIAYDTRLTSVEFSEFVAAVLAANGYQVYLFDGFRPTPELSFAVRYLKTAAGVVVSASHNPASDNGFKAYWNDGGQILPPHDQNIINQASHIDTIKKIDFAEAVQNGQIKMIGKEVDDAYIAAVAQEALTTNREVTMVYSPLHGAGQHSILLTLKAAGFSSVHVVEEQMTPDGHFPNVTNNIPNPELPETATQAIALARQTNADFALTTDPDADRLGVLAKNSQGDYEFLTGNQIATLIGYFVLSQMKEQSTLTDRHFLVRTIVTTDFLDALAAAFNVKIYNHILIGFKYVAGLIKQYEDEGNQTFLFGGEESHGILKGSYTRDKDAAVAALLIAELAATLKQKNKTLVDQLNELYQQHGIFWEKLASTYYAGAAGSAKMAAIMQNLRTDPPREIGGLPVITTIDRLDSTHGEVGDVLIFNLSADNHTRITIRPSGTEPKLKIYTQLHQPISPDISESDLQAAKQAAAQKADELTKAISAYLQ